MPHALKTHLFALAFLAAAWLALGNSVVVLVAASQGRPIDITVCTSMGIKKIALGESAMDNPENQGSKNPQAPAAMKHCGNAAFAVILLPQAHPGQLSFTTPRTVATWQFMQVLGTQTQRNLQSAPPPLRGPPHVTLTAALA